MENVGGSVFEAFSTSAASILQHQVSAFKFSSSPDFTCYLAVIKMDPTAEETLVVKPHDRRCPLHIVSETEENLMLLTEDEKTEQNVFPIG